MSTLGLLGILFVGLKLGGIISWSWWLVLLPFYGGALLVVAIFIAAAIFGTSPRSVWMNRHRR